MQIPRVRAPIRRHPKVLVADGERSVVRYVSDALRRAGYAVVATAGHEEVVQKARAESVDLILLGAPMRPWDLQGCEIVEAIRADPMLASVPVLLLTGKTASAEDIPRCAEMPGVEYITKPFAPVELLTLIRRYFPDLTPQ